MLSLRTRLASQATVRAAAAATQRAPTTHTRAAPIAPSTHKQNVRASSSAAASGSSSSAAGGSAPSGALKAKKGRKRHTVPLNLRVDLNAARSLAVETRAQEAAAVRARPLAVVNEEATGDVEGPPSTALSIVKGFEFPDYFDPRFEPPPADSFQKDPKFKFMLFDPALVGKGAVADINSLKLALDEPALTLWHSRYRWWISSRATKRNALKLRQRKEYIARGWPTRFSSNEETFTKFVTANEDYLAWQDKARLDTMLKPLQFDPALEPDAMFPFDQKNTPDKYHPSFEPIAPQLWKEYGVQARDSEEYRKWFKQWLLDNPAIAQQREVYQRLVNKYVRPVWRARMRAESERMVFNERVRSEMMANAALPDRGAMPEVWMPDFEEEDDPAVIEEQDELIEEGLDIVNQTEEKRLERMHDFYGEDTTNEDFESEYYPLTGDEAAAQYGSKDRFGLTRDDPELEVAKKKWDREFGSLSSRVSARAWSRVYKVLDKASLEGRSAAKREVAATLRANPPVVSAKDKAVVARRQALDRKELADQYLAILRATVFQVAPESAAEDETDEWGNMQERLIEDETTVAYLIQTIRLYPGEWGMKQQLIDDLKRRWQSDVILRAHGIDVAPIERNAPTDRQELEFWLEESRSGFPQKESIRELLLEMARDPEAIDKAAIDEEADEFDAELDERDAWEDRQHASEEKQVADFMANEEEAELEWQDADEIEQEYNESFEKVTSAEKLSPATQALREHEEYIEKLSGEDKIQAELKLAELREAVRTESEIPIVAEKDMPAANAIFAELAASLDPAGDVKSQVDVMLIALDKLRDLTGWKVQLDSTEPRVPDAGEAEPKFDLKKDEEEADYMKFEGLLEHSGTEGEHFRNGSRPGDIRALIRHTKQVVAKPIPSAVVLTPALRKQKEEWIARRDAFIAKPEAERAAEAKAAVLKRYPGVEQDADTLAELIASYRSDRERPHWFACDQVNPAEDLPTAELINFIPNQLKQHQAKMNISEVKPIKQATARLVKSLKAPQELQLKNQAYLTAFRALESKLVNTAVKAALAKYPVAQLVARAHLIDEKLRDEDLGALQAMLTPAQIAAQDAHTRETKRWTGLTPEQRTKEMDDAWKARQSAEKELQRLLDLKEEVEGVRLEDAENITDLLYSPQQTDKLLDPTDQLQLSAIQKEFENETNLLSALDQEVDPASILPITANGNATLNVKNGRVLSSHFDHSVEEAEDDMSMLDPAAFEAQWRKMFDWKKTNSYVRYLYALNGNTLPTATEKVDTIHSAEEKRAADRRTLGELFHWQKAIDDLDADQLTGQSVPIPDADEFPMESIRQMSDADMKAAAEESLKAAYEQTPKFVRDQLREAQAEEEDENNQPAEAEEDADEDEAGEGEAATLALNPDDAEVADAQAKLVEEFERTHPSIPEFIHSFPLRFLDLEMYEFLLKDPKRACDDLLSGIMGNAHLLKDADYVPLEAWDSETTEIDLENDQPAPEPETSFKIELNEEEQQKLAAFTVQLEKDNREKHIAALADQKKNLTRPDSGANVDPMDAEIAELESSVHEEHVEGEEREREGLTSAEYIAKYGLAEKRVTLLYDLEPRPCIVDAEGAVWAKKYTDEDWYRFIENYKPEDLRWDHSIHDEAIQEEEGILKEIDVVDSDYEPEWMLKERREFADKYYQVDEDSHPEDAATTVPNPHVRPIELEPNPTTGAMEYTLTDESSLYNPFRTDVRIPFENRIAGSLSVNSALHHFELRRRSDDDLAEDISEMKMALARQTQENHERPSGRLRHILQQIERAKLRQLEPSKEQIASRVAIIEKAKLLLEAKQAKEANPKFVAPTPAEQTKEQISSAPIPTTHATPIPFSPSNPVTFERESTQTLVDIPSDLVQAQVASTATIARVPRDEQLTNANFQTIEVKEDEIDEDLMNEIIMDSIEEYELVAFDKYGRVLTQAQIDLAPFHVLQNALARIGYLPNGFHNYHLWSNRSLGAGSDDLWNREAMIDLYMEHFSHARFEHERREYANRFDRYGQPVQPMEFDEETDSYLAWKEIQDEEEEDLFENMTEEEIAIWKSYHTDEGVVKWIAEGGLFKTQAAWIEEQKRGSNGVSSEALAPNLSDLPLLTGMDLSFEENDEHVLKVEAERVDQRLAELKLLQWNPDLYVNFFSHERPGEFTPEGRKWIEDHLSTLNNPKDRVQFLKQMLHWKQVVGGDGTGSDDWHLGTWVNEQLAHARKLNEDRRERAKAGLKEAEDDDVDEEAPQEGEEDGDQAHKFSYDIDEDVDDDLGEFEADAKEDEVAEADEAEVAEVADEPDADVPIEAAEDVDDSIDVDAEVDAGDPEADAFFGDDDVGQRYSGVVLGVDGTPVPKFITESTDDDGVVSRKRVDENGELHSLTPDELAKWGPPRLSLDEEFALASAKRNTPTDGESVEDELEEEEEEADEEGDEEYPHSPEGNEQGEGESRRSLTDKEIEHPLLSTWAKPSTLRHVKELPHMDPNRYNEVQAMLNLKQKIYKMMSHHFPTGGITLKISQPQLFYPERKFKEHYGSADENLRKSVSFGGQSGFHLFQVMFLMRKYRNASILSEHIAKELSTARTHGAVLRAVENMVKWIEGIPGLDTGLKIKVSGRINGSSRTRHYLIKSGNIPLQTFHANVDYSYSAAHARVGVFGVKVWLFQRKLDRKEMQSYSLLRGGQKRTRNKFL